VDPNSSYFFCNLQHSTPEGQQTKLPRHRILSCIGSTVGHLRVRVSGRGRDSNSLILHNLEETEKYQASKSILLTRQTTAKSLHDPLDCLWITRCEVFLSLVDLFKYFFPINRKDQLFSLLYSLNP
jgi:hypothetical protein